VIVLTKADLVEDCSEQVLASQKVAPGVEVHAISTITGFGLDVLKDYLKPCKTVVFLAHPVWQIKSCQCSCRTRDYGCG